MQVKTAAVLPRFDPLRPFESQVQRYNHDDTRPHWSVARSVTGCIMQSRDDSNRVRSNLKLSTKSDILDADIQNLDCNVTL